MARALPHLLRARQDIRVVLVGGDGVSYGAPPMKRVMLAITRWPAFSLRT